MVATKQPRIGAHLSTSGGIDKAVEQAELIGANCLQVFSGSPRMWRRTSLEKIDTKKLFAKQVECDVTPIFTHALYLVNLASDNPEILANSVMTLKHDLSFDAHIKGAGVVVHVGSHQGRGFLAMRDQIATQIANILANTPSESRFLIENSAGQNGKIASDLHEISWLIEQLKSPRVGWCLDSCHAFAAGYAFSNNSSVYQSKEPKESNLFSDSNGSDVRQFPVLQTQIKELHLDETLSVIHVNDSRDPFASGRDRHDNIGLGTIPTGELELLVNDQLFTGIPLITEVPGITGEGPDAANIARIKELVKYSGE